ncbi:MAG TPA: hydantoinase B/oxoprolinase family protein [Methanomicrobia archaeon]|nr:hydantoinase B/oxoprolinase family protein [Methanomicrobia archaeon]
MNPILLELLKNAFSAVPEEMGAVLKRTAFSPNIKERMDASCAIFDAQGRMLAQAEHIPVHLGAMPLTVAFAITVFPALQEGDQIVVNDPYHGGSHLPDLTVLKPVFFAGAIAGYVVNRAHHADIGGISPGSMPGTSTDIFQEGLIIPPCRLVARGQENRDVFALIRSNTRTPTERIGDIRAQIAANNLGERRVVELISKYSRATYQAFTERITAYSERRMRHAIMAMPNGTFIAEDVLDDDGITGAPVKLVVAVTITDDTIAIDFEGTDRQRAGNINAPYAVTLSAVYYVLRAVTDPGIPPNYGCYLPVTVHVPVGTVLNPVHPAAVASGNVETAQRIVDVLLLALYKALPHTVPAQSQGTMNNVAIGGRIGDSGECFSYYETIAGGQGALPYKDGEDGIHTHMTNTANTPIEALELAYPLRIEAYELIPGSGGAGRFSGGRGVRRALRILTDHATLSIQSDRRTYPPKGLDGGADGRAGQNYLLRDGKRMDLPAKVTMTLERGDLVVIETPGGGGYGAVP